MPSRYFQSHPKEDEVIQKRIFINGIEQNLFVESDAPLSSVIREQIGLTGTKVGCGKGECGACNVILDGKLIRSCVTKMKRVPDNARITTIEGVGTPSKLHALQRSWAKHGAAQCGFCTPGFIVSGKALLDQNASPTRTEVREWFQKYRNACRCTGYKPIVDAVMDAAKVLRGDMQPEELDFTMPEDGRIWGSSYPRPTAVAKVTGTLDYGADLGLKLPENTLHVALVQAKVSHANIRSIDCSEAEKMPGVVKAVTHKDVRGRNRINGLVVFPETNQSDGWDRPILCDDKVFQYGDALALVCAETKAEALAAVDKVKVDLEPLPAYMSVTDAKATDAVEIHPGTPNQYVTLGLEKGEDTARYFNDPEYVTVDNTTISSRQPHMPIEPDVAFAYHSDDGKLHIHSKSIGVHVHREMLHQGLGLDPENLVIAANPMGGTFGYKLSPTIEGLVGAATMATNRPCIIVFDYRQQMQYTGKRSPFYSTIRFAADKSGKLKAMEIDYDVDHGPYCEFADLLTQRGIQFMGAGYDIPNMRGEGRTICTNHAWGSAFRGFGGPQACLSTEVGIDMLAEKLGMDPLEFRYMNTYRPGSLNNCGQSPESFSFPKMLDALRPKYKAALKKAEQESTQTHKKGVGLALAVYACGDDGHDSSDAYVEMHADGTITVGTAWEDHGQGADAGAIGVAHEALRPMGIDPERLHFTWPDTELTPNSGPASGSRSQVMVGGAIKSACDKLLAAAQKDDGSYMDFTELAATGNPTRYDATYSIVGKPSDSRTGQGEPFGVYMYGVVMAEVTVEIATGKTAVDKITNLLDIGKINNRLLVDGQNYGGIAQGIGLALSEDFEDIQKHATMKGGGFPYIKDIPDDIELIYFEEERQHGAFGAGGTGEISVCGPHPAILNAIYSACGARVNRIPALPERVLEAMPR
jgi:aldehyde oxidoreductase